MYLKEIEITGFKSFADKITLNLDNNITCIVGPNGSGKSNIVDAVRFVLGEQSVKSLRGDSLMADVIFGGSKNRSPMHSASVTLTFDNSDKYLNIPNTLVSVKRRLYKTGENEYYLNNERCRLKDIVDLFLDSNIGRDSFNIIGQGEIAKILSNSASERRIVIEEAAGILKYKKRREEAFKKLDKTNLNLERINDIILEVEERLNPLKNQSKKAHEYLDTKKELEKVEVAYLANEITTTNLEYQDIKNKIKEKEENLVHLNTKIDNPELDKLKVKEIEVSKKIQELNNNLIIKTKEKEELNSKRLLYKERLKYNASDIKVHENIEYLKDRNLNIDKNIKLLKNDLDRITNNKINIENNLNNLIDELNNNKIKLQNIEKDYNIKNKNNLELINKLEILNSNLANNVYLNNNVRSILDNPRLNIIDALINLVEVDSIYQKAFDVVSLSNKNFLIANNESDIKDAINYLKDNKLGRATFLPINVIKSKFVDYDTLNIIKNKEGYLGILSDFLKYEDKYKNIILNQFGNIIVVDNLDNANIISRLINNKYRIVTLLGDVIHIGGSITGGSLNDIKNNLGIKNNINELSIKIQDNKNNLHHLNSEITSLNNLINDLDRNIYTKRSELIKTIDDLNKIKNNLNDLESELENNQEELNSLNGNSQEEDYNKEYYDKSLECELIEKDINEYLKEKDNLSKDISELEGISKENRLLYSNLEREINELNIRLSKLDIKLDNDLNILNSEYSLTYERANNEYSLDMDIESAKNLINEYKNTLKNIGMVNLDSIKEYESVNERYLYLTSERDDLLKAKDMLYSIIDDMDEVMKSDFLNTFKELEVEFKKVFKSMFHGGDATLKLTDQNNLLETGVDIIASPPGKKLKTVTLLSGGEKTLTAISLLFAILNIRKVPFCIFDEVEAALDEANVDNFGTYLENYKEKTQFLLITHKKRTMEYAKTLYGITMQESGVSKLVSVKLEEK